MLSVRMKITIFGVITIVFSLLVGYLVVTPLLIQSETDQYVEEINGQFNIYQSNIEHFRNDLEYSVLLFQQTDDIYTDSTDFTNYLTAYDLGFVFDPTVEEQNIIVSMYDYALINRNVDSIYIGYDNTGAFVRNNPIQQTHDPFEGYNFDPRESLWYQNAIASDGEVVFNEIEQHINSERYYATISTTLYDIDNEFIGVLGIDIDFQSYMENFTQVGSLSSGQFIYTQGDKAVVIEEDGSITISPLNDVYEGFDFVLEMNGFNTREVELDGTEYLAIVSQVEGTSIRLVHLISNEGFQNIIMTKVSSVRSLFIGISLSLILAMLVVQEFVVLKPLGVIQEDIKGYKTSNITSHYRFLEEGSKEFVQIASVLNEMVDTINDNMGKMSERIREMNCLYEVTRLAYQESKIDHILEGTTHAIVEAMKYPEDAFVHIKYKQTDYYSAAHQPSQWSLSVDLKSMHGVEGKITVYYLSEQLEEDIGPFENEELALLENVSNLLQIALTYRS